MPDERRDLQLRDGKRDVRHAPGGLGEVGGTGLGIDRWLATVAAAQHGLVTRRQMTAAGIGRGAIEARIARGQLHPLHHGIYALGHQLLTREGRWLAAVLACGDRAALSRRSAGVFWGIVPRFEGYPEVTRPSAGRRDGIVVIRGSLPSDEVEVEGGIPVTSVARTLFDFAGVSSERQLERAMNEARVRGLTSQVSLPQLLKRYPRRRGAKKLRALLSSRRPEGITRNDFEEAFVALLDAHGLPRPRLNATLWVGDRFIEPDCVWGAQRLLLELDGREVHGTEQAFESDRERDRTLLVAGWRSTRVTWRQLDSEPARIAADLRVLLGAT